MTTHRTPEEWKTAICDECGKGYESKESYDDRHFDYDGAHIEVHEKCCLSCTDAEFEKQCLLDNLEVCPDCGYLSVSPDMNGVTCDNPNCDYWFCF